MIMTNSPKAENCGPSSKMQKKLKTLFWEHFQKSILLRIMTKTSITKVPCKRNINNFYYTTFIINLATESFKIYFALMKYTNGMEHGNKIVSPI